MHKSVRERKITGTGGKDKTIVAGIMERDGRVRASIVPDTGKATLQSGIRASVEAGAIVYTDAHGGYSGLNADFVHEVVDHAEKYVEGKIHINSMENFWARLKRGLHGTYVSVDRCHLYRYLDERVFTFNHRKEDDLARFCQVIAHVAGRRLTYSQVTAHAAGWSRCAP